MIRLATPADARAIAEVQTRAWWRAYQDILDPAYLAERTADAREPEWEQRLLEQPDGLEVALFELEGRVAGFVATSLERAVGDVAVSASVGELAALYVDPPAQGAGVGGALHDHALARLAQRGFGDAVLWCFRDNGHARGFYEHRGWALDPGSEAQARAVWETPAVRYRHGLG
jgi:GNAT superfamily N-acetyltransferase